jgi:uncharacterized iron-regulated membrane protein
MTQRILFWTHLVLGVAAETAILVMSATGVLLTFQRLAPAPTRQEPGRPQPGDDAGRDTWRQPTGGGPRRGGDGGGRTGVRLALDEPRGSREQRDVRRGDAGRRQCGQAANRTELVVDSRSGSVLRVTRFGDRSLAQRLRALARFLHTGEEGGLLGQPRAAAASAGGALLVRTGLSLALRRLRAARG